MKVRLKSHNEDKNKNEKKEKETKDKQQKGNKKIGDMHETKNAKDNKSSEVCIEVYPRDVFPDDKKARENTRKRGVLPERRMPNWLEEELGIKEGTSGATCASASGSASGSKTARKTSDSTHASELLRCADVHREALLLPALEVDYG